MNNEEAMDGFQYHKITFWRQFLPPLFLTPFVFLDYLTAITFLGFAGGFSCLGSILSIFGWLAKNLSARTDKIPPLALLRPLLTLAITPLLFQVISDSRDEARLATINFAESVLAQCNLDNACPAPDKFDPRISPEGRYQIDIHTVTKFMSEYRRKSPTEFSVIIPYSFECGLFISGKVGEPLKILEPCIY